jgi:hypothetical protein
MTFSRLYDNAIPDAMLGIVPVEWERDEDIVRGKAW